eukprot:1177374-Rhodomonas_salina.1
MMMWRRARVGVSKRDGREGRPAGADQLQLDLHALVVLLRPPYKAASQYHCSGMLIRTAAYAPR